MITFTSTGIQSFEYSYDELANMTDRYDHLHKINDLSLHEHFTYDNRNQLKTITKNGVLQCEMLYDGLGSIYLKTDVGDLNCIAAGNPYQLTEIIPNLQINPAYKTDEHITYTDFNKVDTITTAQYLLEIKYGLGNERLSQKSYSKNGQTQTLLSEKTYVAGLAEIVELSDGSSKTINYISSPEGLVAVEISQSSGSKEWYWVFTDHLGSITSLVRESDGQKFEMSFDAWGNRRDPATWVNYTTTLPDFIIDRGFTGHEHYDEFGLINMNGRVYDPVIARFLSPDSYIQAPGLAQNYNGYIYCLNNPLRYTDPDGDFVILAAIILGAYLGGSSINGTFNPLEWDYSDPATYGGIIVGGLAGWAGASVGMAAGASALASGATAIEAGIAAGMTGGIVTGAINGTGLTALSGGNLEDMFAGMVQGAVMGGFAGAASGGTGALIGDFSGVTGGGFKNAMYEIGHSIMKGGSQGLASGGVMAAMNQDASYLWKGATFGAIIGGGMSTLRIATMGAAFIPDPDTYCELENFGQVYRRGSLFTPRGAGITLGRNVVVKLTGNTDYDRYLLHHETGHLSQINDMGVFKFYSRTIREYIKIGLNNVYGTSGTLENNAEWYSYQKLGYYYGWRGISYSFP